MAYKIHFLKLNERLRKGQLRLIQSFSLSWHIVGLYFEVAACDRVLIENSGEDLECKGMDAEAGGPWQHK